MLRAGPRLALGDEIGAPRTSRAGPEPIGGQQFGRLRIGLAEGTDLAAVVQYLEEAGASVARPGSDTGEAFQ